MTASANGTGKSRTHSRMLCSRWLCYHHRSCRRTAARSKQIWLCTMHECVDLTNCGAVSQGQQHAALQTWDLHSTAAHMLPAREAAGRDQLKITPLMIPGGPSQPLTIPGGSSSNGGGTPASALQLCAPGTQSHSSAVAFSPGLGASSAVGSYPERRRQLHGRRLPVVCRFAGPPPVRLFQARIEPQQAGSHAAGQAQQSLRQNGFNPSSTARGQLRRRPRARATAVTVAAVSMRASSLPGMHSAMYRALTVQLARSSFRLSRRCRRGRRSGSRRRCRSHGCRQASRTCHQRWSLVLMTARPAAPDLAAWDHGSTGPGSSPAGSPRRETARRPAATGSPSRRCRSGLPFGRGQPMNWQRQRRWRRGDQQLHVWRSVAGQCRWRRMRLAAPRRQRSPASSSTRLGTDSPGGSCRARRSDPFSLGDCSR